MTFKAIIFDCDGVIVDTESIANRIMQSKLAQLGLVLSDQYVQAEFTGYTTDHNLEKIKALLTRELPPSFKEDYKADFQAAIAKHLDPIQGIPELLDNLRPLVAMATNAQRQEMEFKLAKIGLTSVFNQRFCVNDVTHAKPSPEIYLLAAESLQVSAKDCLVIEDSPAGIQAGVRAGMTVYAYSEKMDKEKQLKAGASKCFDSMKALRHHLNQLHLYY